MHKSDCHFIKKHSFFFVYFALEGCVEAASEPPEELVAKSDEGYTHWRLT